MCRSILSLSKIAHQMWSDHPFSQRKNDKRKSSGGACWNMTGKWGQRRGVDKIGKRRGEVT